MTLPIVIAIGFFAWLIIDSITSGISARRGMKQGKEVLRKMEQVFALLRAKMSEEEMRELAQLIYEESGNAVAFASLDEDWQEPYVAAARAAEKFVKESLFKHCRESEADNGR